MSVSAKVGNVQYQKQYEKVRSEYESDEQFIMMKKEYGEKYAEDFLNNVIQQPSLSKLARDGGGNICYRYVQNIMQTKRYNCGTTTVLQTLYGLNSASTVAGTTNSDKIETLDDEYDIDRQGSMIVYQVVDALNKYNAGNQVYVYRNASNMTQNSFEEYVATSLTYCKPVILHAKTGYLSYYGGKDLGHYLSLDYINRTSDIVRIVDCNYDSRYYGIHTNIPLSEAYNAIHAESGRYLIY